MACIPIHVRVLCVYCTHREHIVHMISRACWELCFGGLWVFIGFGSPLSLIAIDSHRMLLLACFICLSCTQPYMAIHSHRISLFRLIWSLSRTQPYTAIHSHRISLLSVSHAHSHTQPYMAIQISVLLSNWLGVEYECYLGHLFSCFICLSCAPIHHAITLHTYCIHTAYKARFTV